MEFIGYAVAERHIDHIGVDDGAGSAAGLNTQKLSAVGAAAADFINDIFQVGTFGEFINAAVHEVPGKAVHFGTGRAGETKAFVPCRAVIDDRGQVRQSFNVIDEGRFPEKPFIGRIRRFETGFAAMAFNRFEHGGFFAADISAAAGNDTDIKTEITAENVIAEETGFTGIADGVFQYGEDVGIFKTKIDITDAGADGISGDGHPFQQTVGVTGHDDAVFVGCGFPFVSVADEVFLIRVFIEHEAQFSAGGETCAAAADQTGSGYFFHDAFRRHGQRFLQTGIAAQSAVFRNGTGIIFAHIAQNDSCFLHYLTPPLL